MNQNTVGNYPSSSSTRTCEQLGQLKLMSLLHRSQQRASRCIPLKCRKLRQLLNRSRIPSVGINCCVAWIAFNWGNVVNGCEATEINIRPAGMVSVHLYRKYWRLSDDGLHGAHSREKYSTRCKQFLLFLIGRNIKKEIMVHLETARIIYVDLRSTTCKWFSRFKVDQEDHLPLIMIMIVWTL